MSKIRPYNIRVKCNFPCHVVGKNQTSLCIPWASKNVNHTFHRQVEVVAAGFTKLGLFCGSKFAGLHNDLPSLAVFSLSVIPAATIGPSIPKNKIWQNGFLMWPQKKMDLKFKPILNFKICNQIKLVSLISNIFNPL